MATSQDSLLGGLGPALGDGLAGEVDDREGTFERGAVDVSRKMIKATGPIMA